MGGDFLTWLYYRTKWACSCGWAFAINERYPDPVKACAKFFKLMDEYRQLRPTILCSVRLAARHRPTGKRERRSANEFLEKPQSVDVVRYCPKPLHFIRFHYRSRIENTGILMTGTGDYATTIRYAKDWVRDEFQVELSAWRRLPNS